MRCFFLGRNNKKSSNVKILERQKEKKRKRVGPCERKEPEREVKKKRPLVELPPPSSVCDTLIFLLASGFRVETLSCCVCVCPSLSSFQKGTLSLHSLFKLARATFAKFLLLFRLPFHLHLRLQRQQGHRYSPSRVSSWV